MNHRPLGYSDAEQVWQRSDLSGADLRGPLEAASRQRLKESLVAHTHRLAVMRPQSLENFQQADLTLGLLARNEFQIARDLTGTVRTRQVPDLGLRHVG
ncbi:MAG: hypothetical protein WB762_02955 [Candidatus Sulfotelmatobacter sp.]